MDVGTIVEEKLASLMTKHVVVIMLWGCWEAMSPVWDFSHAGGLMDGDSSRSVWKDFKIYWRYWRKIWCRHSWFPEDEVNRLWWENIQDLLRILPMAPCWQVPKPRVLAGWRWRSTGQFEIISTTIGGIGMKCGTNIHSSQRMKFSSSGEKTSQDLLRILAMAACWQGPKPRFLAGWRWRSTGHSHITSTTIGGMAWNLVQTFIVPRGWR